LRTKPIGLPDGRGDTLSAKQLLLEPFKSRNVALSLSDNA
jgi:hypothetical protein